MSIWVAATLLMVPAFLSGHIISDSSYLNVAWSEGFAQELLSGHLYPRWLPKMSGGTGSPVFYFYGPLPFYLTAPFHLIAAPRSACLLGTWLMLGLSGQAFFALASNFVQTLAARVAALAYMAMPYHLLVDIWLRSAAGEQAAYIFMPLCLLCVFRLAADRRWTFALAANIAGLLYSHLPSALLFAPFLAGTCLFVAWRQDFTVVMVRAVTAACLGLGLAAAYVVPALTMQGLIHPASWDNNLPIGNLLFLRRTPALELLLDAIVIVSVSIDAIFVVTAIKRNRWLPVAPWAIIAAAVVLLVLPIAATLWSTLPSVFDRIQFPWRALVSLDIASCMLFALMLQSGYWKRAVVILLFAFGLIAIGALFFALHAREGDDGFRRRPARAEDALIAFRAEPLEYLPSCRPFRALDVSDGTSTFIVKRSLSERRATELPVFYYPFLEARVNGKAIPTRCDTKTGFIVVGRYQGPVAITKRSIPPEHISYMLSAASALIVLLALLFSSGKTLDRLLAGWRRYNSARASRLIRPA